MRRLVYYVAVTLDGWIAGADGGYEFFRMEGDHLQAQIEELPETMPTHVRNMLGIIAPPARFDTVVMGRRTHQPALDAGLTSGYQHLRQHVFTRSGDLPDDDTVTVQSGDPLAVVRDLKAEPGSDIWLCGGGNLAAQLVDEIDELILKVNPVVIGSGTPLFEGGTDARQFRLISSRRFGSGVVVNRYER